MSAKRLLAFTVALLLIQLFLRAHNITTLPVFIDEDNHIRRAATVYDGATHPALESHGKLLLYFWLGVFDMDERDTALHLSRTMIALTSLLTSALVFATVKTLTKRRDVAFLAAAFYALAPYTLFYERMALADPFAGMLGAATVLLVIRFGRLPTLKRSLMAGIFAALTVMAKLTMAFAVFFLPLAAVFFGRDEQNNIDKLRRYFLPLSIAGAVFVLIWLPVVIPARLSLQNDDPADDFILVNTILVEDENQTPSFLLFQNAVEAWRKSATMLLTPFALGLGLLVVMGWVKMTDEINFLGLALIVSWLPSLIFVQNLQTRYLMAGFPLIAMMLGVTLEGVRRNPNFDRRVYNGALAIFAMWAGLFALPFAFQLMSEPAVVNMPDLDERNYFWDRYNAYGDREAFGFLQAEGERHTDDQVYVLPLTKVCRQLDLHPQPNVQHDCIEGYNREVLADIDWEPYAERYLADGVPLYITTSEQLDAPPLESRYEWELVARFPKPQGILYVDVWRVSPRDG